MKKALAIAGILALSITPTASFASHRNPLWSRFRPGGDLSHTNLSGLNLRHRAQNSGLSGINLSNAGLNGANLNDTNLNGANLSNATMIGTQLSNADLRNANLSGANLWNANLSNANLTGANLGGADLSIPGWSGINLTGITATNLRGCPRTLPNGWVCQNNSLIRR